MDGLFQPDLPLPPAALPDRLSASDGLFLRGADPDLSIMDPYRGDPADAPMIRGGDEPDVATPRPQRRKSALSRTQLRGRFHHREQHFWQLRARARNRSGEYRHAQTPRRHEKHIGH